MATWGKQSFDNDAAMDAVGDVWRNVFESLPSRLILDVLTPFFQRDDTERLHLMLWTFCTVELPEPLIRRLGCLLTTNIEIARAFISRIGDERVADGLSRALRSPHYSPAVLTGAISFFVNEVGVLIKREMTDYAVGNLRSMLERTNDAEECDVLQREISGLC